MAKHQIQKVKMPASLVPAFEAALASKSIAAGIDFHNDGSRTYSIDTTNHPMQEISAAVDKAFKEMMDLLGD